MAVKTIVVKGQGVRKERIANAAITPGHLVEVMSTGKLRKHATAAGTAQKAFAVEDDLQGKVISDDYAAASIVQYNVMQPGDEVYALIKDGETIVIGDYLESGGDGTLQKQSVTSAGEVEYPGSAVAVALEAVDMSGSSAADPSGRCIVEIL